MERAVEQQMMAHVATAQETNRAAVQKSMEQVPKEFGTQNRGGQPGENCECGFHEAELRRNLWEWQATSRARSALSEDDVHRFQVASYEVSRFKFQRQNHLN